MAEANTLIAPRPSRRSRVLGGFAFALIAAFSALFVFSTRGCDESASAAVLPMTISGKKFYLEVSDDDAKRFKGLSDRMEIVPDGGMLFIFPRAASLNFVMRDCPIDIDIIFCDATGRVTAKHSMKSEPPRDPVTEPKPAKAGDSDAYELRLRKYPSGAPAQFVIELRGGTLDSLNVPIGTKIIENPAALKARAR